jgi:acyl-CoA thioesterase I
MNERLAVVSACVLLALPAAAGMDPVTILAFGDSLTAGKDLADPDRAAYPAVLESLLAEKGHRARVINGGHSGDTTFDALARLDFSLQDKPDVVLIALGHNDTFQGKALKDIERNLNAIVERVKATGAVPLLCAMKTFPNFGPHYALGFQRIYKRVAAEQKVPLAPFFLEGVAGAPSMNLSDGVHPNALGHRRMAENLLPAVEKVLRGKSFR